VKTTTFGLCNECYATVPAVADPFPTTDTVPMLYKYCPEHGIQRGKLESDREFYKQFKGYERNNHYPVLIINVTDSCNIKCKHCFYPIKNQWHMPIEQFKNLITVWKGRFSQFILSGGDPTVWKHYFQAAAWCKEQGIVLSQLTNGVRFNDPLFWEEVKEHWTYHNRILMAEISVHPENITSPGVRDQQLRVLQKLRDEKLKVSCIMMNVDTSEYSSLAYSHHALYEVLEQCVDMIQTWKDVSETFRIRPICFDAWGSTTKGDKWFLSDLVKALEVVTRRRNLDMHYSYSKDVDNIYNQNFIIDGTQVVTVCAANIRDLDLGFLNRGPFMLANDGKPYSVPHALIINEGIDKGFYGGCKC
jgi:uncharacterized Fe-S cluster-containing radical SAM superfamily protein